MKSSYFFCGIGGSGMLSLALIARSYGYQVSGSDRAFDQGKNPRKFAFLKDQDIALTPQDGSGLTEGVTALIVSTAVEDHIPDVKRAKELNIPILHRAEFLASLFNAAPKKIAVAGTSGKTTVTGMIGFALRELELDPTVMNGGVFRNYIQDSPYGSALTGKGDVFLTESDESDGSIALYNPDIGLLNNIALDHKTLEELETLFDGFLNRTKQAVVNFDNEGVRQLAAPYAEKVIGFGLENAQADLTAKDIKFSSDGVEATVSYKGEGAHLKIQLAGRYNLSNALGAIGVLLAMDIPFDKAVHVLEGFSGIKRRMEKIGTKNGILVFDDFAHNPDKIKASLKSLKNFNGRLIVFFQPHGFGFLKSLHNELAETFSTYLTSEDTLILVEPYYAGGTVDRTIGSKDVIEKITGVDAHLCDDRHFVKSRILSMAKKGDRIIIMGARDDTLSEFAEEIYEGL